MVEDTYANTMLLVGGTIIGTHRGDIFLSFYIWVKNADYWLVLTTMSVFLIFMSLASLPQTALIFMC